MCRKFDSDYLYKKYQSITAVLKMGQTAQHSTGRHTCIYNYFGYCVVIVSLVSKINVASLSEFIDIPLVLIIVSVTLVRFVAIF